MEINFSKLSVYPDEYNNYWELPVTYPILHGNPERPIEDWHHHWGRAVLYFVFTDAQAEADISVEFIDPSGTSRGKVTRTLHANQGYGCSNVDFDKLGTWKIKGTLNGMVKTWDALNIIPIDVPPNTQKFEKEFIDVAPGADIGVKFTTENWLSYGAYLTPRVTIYNPVTSSFVSYQGDTVYRAPAEQFGFACMKLGGWQSEGLCLARLCVHQRLNIGIGDIAWAAYDVPIANIAGVPPPPPPPPPPDGEFSLEITNYQRV